MQTVPLIYWVNVYIQTGSQLNGYFQHFLDFFFENNAMNTENNDETIRQFKTTHLYLHLNTQSVSGYKPKYHNTKQIYSSVMGLY